MATLLATTAIPPATMVATPLALAMVTLLRQRLGLIVPIWPTKSTLVLIHITLKEIMATTVAHTTLLAVVSITALAMVSRQTLAHTNQLS